MALCGASAESWSIGLGRVTSAATLGQPLAITLPVRLEAGEALAPECIHAEVFFGDNRQPASAVQVAAGAEGIRITTSTLVDEPVVNTQVSVGCTSQVSRKFTLFADPPAVNLAQVPSAPQPRATAAQPRQNRPQESQVQVAAAPTPAPAARQRRSPAASRTTTAQTRARSPASTVQARRAERTAAERTASATPRLQLDPIDAGVLADPGLRLDDTLPPPSDGGGSAQQAAASTLWRALNTTPEEMARDREKLQKLEEQLVAIRRDSAATRESLAALQARLLRAEEERYANPLVLGLTAFCALLLVLLGYTWWQQRRQMQAAWWKAEGQAVAETMAQPGAAHSSEAQGMLRKAEPEVTDPTPFTTTAAAGFSQAPVPPPPQVRVQEELPVVVPPPAEAPRREVSVEELIDLEQQAEFFVVLGQEDAAIDLLMSHVRNTAGTSPLPYLKLLEIYQHRGDRAEYDRIRDRFNNRFNAYAPSWDEDLMQGRSLADYPDVIRRLESLWATPAHALDVLQASLLRQDENAGTFDLPAYRELLFLYSIARDLSDTGRATGDVVDLLLPLDDEPNEAAAFTLTTMGPLVAEPSAPRDASEQRRSSKAPADEVPSLLDLDLDLAMAGEGAPSPESARYSGMIEFERLDITQPLPKREA